VILKKKYFLFKKNHWN